MQLFGPPLVLTVTQVTRYLKDVLRTDELLQDVWVQGEITDCRTYPSGHCYFTLKEGDAQLLCVFFKNARLRSSAPDLRNGMAVTLNGHISFYERDGKLQLYVENAEPVGDGALYLRFEQLKERLEAEGLFAEERKRPIPSRPAVIGIVTSPQAAALRDMLRVLHVRYPLARVILAPTLVQGADAPASIAAALDLLNEHAEADVIIVGRGGGAREELWAFNEEIVARAIARSRIPVISGVGHETDFTIADFVADLRASTPTAAAAAAVPNIEDWRDGIGEMQETLTSLVEERLYDLSARLERTKRELQRASPQSQLDSRHQQLDDATELLQTRIQHILALRQERLRGLALRLHSLSPLLTIVRGYSIVRCDSDRSIVTSVQQVQPGDGLTIQVTDGHIPVEVRSLS